jgi:galactokinase
VREEAASAFDALFAGPPAVVASAPGRVNLIGEHTDYNGGFVLPIATPQETTIAMRRRGDGLVHAWSRDVGDEDAWTEFRLGEETRRGHWSDYVAGVTASLRESQVTVEGFDARIASDLPLGGGLSSSASLEVALLRALRQLFGLDIDDVSLAAIAHRAETGLVGAPVGIMDQMAASLAARDAALFLDTRSLTYQRIHLPPASALIVIHSGVTHRHAGGEYRTRRRECEEAARELGVRELRDVDPAMLAQAHLPAPLDRRARHVVSEDVRVVEARDALIAGDARQFGALMNASHESMRDDFEISTPEIDTLVEVARQQPEIYGARMTGGGFGGSAIALVPLDRADAVASEVRAAFAEARYREPEIRGAQPSAGAERVG